MYVGFLSFMLYSLHFLIINLIKFSEVKFIFLIPLVIYK